MKKSIKSLILSFLFLINFVAMSNHSVFAAGTDSIVDENSICILSDNENQRVSNPNITYRILDGQTGGEATSLSTSKLLYSIYSGTMENADKGIKKGDFITVKIDDRLRFHGILDRDQYVVYTMRMDGQTIAEGEFDSNTGVITYRFIQDMDAYDRFDFSITGMYIPDEKKITTDGQYTFENELAGNAFPFNGTVEYNPPVGGQNEQALFGNKKSPISSEWNLYNINLNNNTFYRYIFVNKVVTTDTAQELIDKNFGFKIGTISTPVSGTGIKVYRAPAQMTDSLYVDPNSLTEDLTSQFTITPIDANSNLYTSNIKLDEQGFYIIESGSFVPGMNFSASLVPLLLNEDGTQVAINEFDATSLYSTVILEHFASRSKEPGVKCIPARRINISKTDSQTGANLEGAQFNIFNSNGELVETLTTSSEGKATSSLLKVGNYTVEEAKAPEGYVLSDEVHNVTLSIDVNEPFEVAAKNDKILKQIEINKVDSKTDAPLKGVEFEIYSGENLLEKLVTDVNGKAISKELPLGKYTIIETKTIEGYEIIQPNTEVELVEDENKVISVTIKNNKVEVPEEPKPEEPKPEEPKPEKPNNERPKPEQPKTTVTVEKPNPQTGDVGVVSFVTPMLLAGIGLIVINKKKK